MWPEKTLIQDPIHSNLTSAATQLWPSHPFTKQSENIWSIFQAWKRRLVTIASSRNWKRKYKSPALFTNFPSTRSLTPLAVLGLIRRREQLAWSRKGIEEQDQMFCVSPLPLQWHFRRETKLKKKKLTLSVLVRVLHHTPHVSSCVSVSFELPGIKYSQLNALNFLSQN